MQILLEEIQKIKVLQDKEEIQYKDIQQETDEYNNRNIAANILPGIEECRQQFLQAGLTRREAEVALLVIKHMSNAEIANELYISETTVKKHVSNIFSKLDISKREQIKDIIS
ncbi:MAG: helix-turn-helix transcriptional regulator [Lachnospiraceae bacterium]|nr:helix-turn-helix transcriptional regulator [Lachnospiraceae bacterium]